MFYKAFFFLLVASQLFSQTILKETYSIDSNEIYLNTIIPYSSENKLLYTINSNKHSKRVKSSELIKLLKEFGIDKIKATSRYVKFQIKSPVDTKIIETFLKQHYLQKYKTIQIKQITVNSRGYLDSLPKNYTVEIRPRSHLSHKGVVNIKDINNKKTFFNYIIEADIKVLQTKKKINSKEKISFLNTQYINIKFDKFKASPITVFQDNTIQTSRQIKSNKILTMRDIEGLDMVQKNSQINVGLNNSGIYITFSAKALQNGKLGDIITIQKSDFKRLKARVVGKNKVEIK